MRLALLQDDRDDDDALLDELRRPHTVDEAWESLQYWRARRASLSPLRRRDRREADQMIEAWGERLKAAERAEYGPPVWEPLAQALRLHRLPFAYRRARRNVRRAVIATVAVGATISAAAAGATAVIVAHLL
jgi:hypothetical protein